jgi:hypothetical protein
MSMTRRPLSFPLAIIGALLALAFAAPPALADDTTPPADTTALPAAGPGGWYAGTPVDVTLSATDDDSGVASFEYTLDGAATVTAAAGDVVAVTGDGTHVLAHRVADAAGNWSGWTTDTVSIDATAPDDTTAAPMPGGLAGWFVAAPVSVTLSASDTGSGADSFEYRVDGGAVQTAAPGTAVALAGEGARTLAHRVRDVAGSWSAWTTTTVQVDTVVPENTTPAISAAWRSTDGTFALSGSDATSGVDHIEWTLDGAPHTGSTATVTGDGVHALATRIVDGAGNASPWRTDSVRIDSVAPADTTAISAGWRPGTQTVTVSGADAGSGVARMEYQLDGGSVLDGSGGSTSVTISGEGEHTLRTRAVDNAGNASPWTDRAVRIDSTAPSNLTPVADAAWRASAYGVVLDASDAGAGVDHVEYRIDGAAARSVPPGTAIQVTGSGAHTLLTRALDLAGNASAWRQDTIDIDLVAPTDTTVAPGSGAVANPYHLAIAGTDAHSGIDHVEWQVDGGDVQTGASGSQATVSGGGAHSLRERVVDMAGNASGWRTFAITIDPTLNADTSLPTDSTAIASPAWRTGPASVTVQGSDAGSGLDHMEWRLDGQPIARGATGSVVTIAADGVHTLETRAVDVAGNASGWNAQTIRIDTSVPTDTTDAPGGWSRSRTIDVSGTDATSGVASVEYKLDSGSTQTGPSGTTATFAGDGTHTLAHRVIDAAGQASPWVTSTLKIDTVPPVDTTPALPTAWQSAALVQALTGSDAGSGLDHLEWDLDGGAAQPGPVKVDADGTHVVRTRAVDVAGNVSAWRATTVKVDVRPPENTSPAAGGAWRTSPYAVTVTADDGAGSGVSAVQWRLGDDGDITPSADAVVDAEGETILQTRAIDAVGHASDWRSETVRIDRVAPLLSLDCGSAGWRSTAASCAAAADGGPSGLAGLTVGGRAVASGATVPVDGDGEQTITAVAIDGAGNRAELSRTVRVDRTPPAATLACRPTAAATGYRCVAGATDAAAGVALLQWRLNGGAWAAPAADGSFAVGSGRVEVRAVDRAGLATVSAPAVLAERLRVRTRQRTVPVSLHGTKGSAGLLGSLELRVVRDSAGQATAVADLRPLAVGKGRYRTTLTLRSGGLRAERRRAFRLRHGGVTPRLGLALSRVKRPARAALVVERRAGKRWVRVATAAAAVKPPAQAG